MALDRAFQLVLTNELGLEEARCQQEQDDVRRVDMFEDQWPPRLTRPDFAIDPQRAMASSSSVRQAANNSFAASTSACEYDTKS